MLQNTNQSSILLASCAYYVASDIAQISLANCDDLTADPNELNSAEYFIGQKSARDDARDPSTAVVVVIAAADQRGQKRISRERNSSMRG
jgi:hypothetical protein